MKITKIETITIDLPFENPGPKSPFVIAIDNTLSSLLIRIETDKGIVGWGEAFGYNCLEATKTTLHTMIIPQLIGKTIENKNDIELINKELQLKLHVFGRYGITMFALSGIDIALWDILGKAENKSIAKLLGGLKTDVLTAYASLFLYDNAEATAKVSLKAKSEGYEIIKLHENTIAPIQSSRSAIGDTHLMVDVNCVWSEDHTNEIIEELKEANLYWLEEPIWPPENFVGLSKLRKQGITIATGENACTSYQFKEMISQNAADILQPSVTKVGGISEIIKISALKKSNCRVVPHSPYFGPGFIATLQVIGALNPDSEIERLYVDLKADIYNGISNINSDGKILIPNGPGLGIEPDLETIEQYIRH
ncbi:MAG TPA: mandelate racemase/muconate lactonizing enzyme family protein [Alphaproteobacteria bacterium]|nr:mandelate racemase/muconate lactonizing enzyme family protein [Alphaproteobacteria bacterium]